jgi:hypothetical protein
MALWKITCPEMGDYYVVASDRNDALYKFESSIGIYRIECDLIACTDEVIL